MVAGAAALLGLWWALTALGLLRWAGITILVAGGVLAFQAVRRARFRSDGRGLGVVEVDERQITYFAPSGGAALSIDTLVRVEFDARAPRAWLFHSDGAAPLRIPADARGAETLFDALAPLPGADFDLALRAARGDGPHLSVIWTKPRRRLH
jgi:hypothetical protein